MIIVLDNPYSVITYQPKTEVVAIVPCTRISIPHQDHKTVLFALQPYHYEESVLISGVEKYINSLGHVILLIV